MKVFTRRRQRWKLRKEFRWAAEKVYKQQAEVGGREDRQKEKEAGTDTTDNTRFCEV